MSAEQTTTGFPLDWDEWRAEWRDWLAAHRGQLRPTKVRFPGKNFLADDILGVWEIAGRVVELSEVVFPNLDERDPATGRLLDHQVRMVGLTFMGHGGIEAGPVVHSFAELEDALELKVIR